MPFPRAHCLHLQVRTHKGNGAYTGWPCKVPKVKLRNMKLESAISTRALKPNHIANHGGRAASSLPEDAEHGAIRWRSQRAGSCSVCCDSKCLHPRGLGSSHQPWQAQFLAASLFSLSLVSPTPWSPCQQNVFQDLKYLLDSRSPLNTAASIYSWVLIS